MLHINSDTNLRDKKEDDDWDPNNTLYDWIILYLNFWLTFLIN